MRIAKATKLKQSWEWLPQGGHQILLQTSLSQNNGEPSFAKQFWVHEYQDEEWGLCRDTPAIKHSPKEKLNDSTMNTAPRNPVSPTTKTTPDHQVENQTLTPWRQHSPLKDHIRAFQQPDLSSGASFAQCCVTYHSLLNSLNFRTSWVRKDQYRHLTGSWRDARRTLWTCVHYTANAEFMLVPSTWWLEASKM